MRRSSLGLHKPLSMTHPNGVKDIIDITRAPGLSVLDRIVATENATVIKAYEVRIQGLGEEKALLAEQVQKKHRTRQALRRPIEPRSPSLQTLETLGLR